MDQNQQNIIKPTNHKKIGAIFWWGFSDFRTKSSKTRLENGGGDSKFVINVAHDTKMLQGGDPKWRSFTNWRGIHEEREEHEEQEGKSQEENTQEQVQSHIH